MAKRVNEGMKEEINRIDSWINQGWSEHTDGQDDQAESSFRKAITLDPKSIEAFYGLAMVLKSQQRKKEAVQVFSQVLQMTEEISEKDHARKAMLRRISKGHINFLNSGDWNLEKEIWQKKA